MCCSANFRQNSWQNQSDAVVNNETISRSIICAVAYRPQVGEIYKEIAKPWMFGSVMAAMEANLGLSCYLFRPQRPAKSVGCMTNLWKDDVPRYQQTMIAAGKARRLWQGYGRAASPFFTQPNQLKE
jgi:hypothetical protein